MNKKGRKAKYWEARVRDVRERSKKKKRPPTVWVALPRDAKELALGCGGFSPGTLLTVTSAPKTTCVFLCAQNNRPQHICM